MAYKTVDFGPETRRKIAYAIDSIINGEVARADISKNVKVYECKNVIRIDLKLEDVEEK